MARVIMDNETGEGRTKLTLPETMWAAGVTVGAVSGIAALTMCLTNKNSGGGFGGSYDDSEGGGVSFL